MKYINRFFLALATAFFVSACGGGGGGGTPTPTLPANATTITAVNATDVATSAVDVLATVDAATSILGVEAQKLPPAHFAIETVTDFIFNHEQRSYSVVSGVTRSIQCPGGGTATGTYDETTTSASGSISFSNCNLAGLVVNGSASFNSTWNNSTGDYNDAGSGSLSFVYGSESFSMVMTYSETGNDNTYDFSQNVSYSVSSSVGGGYLVTTLQNITGNYYNDPADVFTGQLLIQGGNNTRLRLTVIATNTVRVELDSGNGTFVDHDIIYL